MATTTWALKYFLFVIDCKVLTMHSEDNRQCVQRQQYVITVSNFDFVNNKRDLCRVSVIFFCFVFNFSIVQVLFRLVTSEQHQLISVPRKVRVMFFSLCFPIDLSNLSITFPSSVKHYNFTPDFSDSPIFRTTLRFPWKFEKPGFHDTAIVSHVLLKCT